MCGIYDSKMPKYLLIMQKKMISFPIFFLFSLLLLLQYFVFIDLPYTLIITTFVYTIARHRITHFYLKLRKRKIHINKTNQKILQRKLNDISLNESSTKQFGICNQLFREKKKKWFLHKHMTMIENRSCWLTSRCDTKINRIKN